MRAVTVAPEQRLEVSEVPDTEPGEGEVTVEVAACGICGSDVTILDSGFPIFGIPGHEIAGELEDGTPVAIEPIAPCGTCRYCRTGDTQVCTVGNSMIYGIGRDGGMAEALRVAGAGFSATAEVAAGADAGTAALSDGCAAAAVPEEQRMPRERRQAERVSMMCCRTRGCAGRFTGGV